MIDYLLYGTTKGGLRTFDGRIKNRSFPFTKSIKDAVDLSYVSSSRTLSEPMVIILLNTHKYDITYKPETNKYFISFNRISLEIPSEDIKIVTQPSYKKVRIRLETLTKIASKDYSDYK